MSIHAFAINKRKIIVKCPYHNYHEHGSAGDLGNREEDRYSDCDKLEYNCIIIDSDTLRCDVNKKGKPLKRSFKFYENWNN